MQTRIHPNLIENAEVKYADSILRNCVHCGFCLATCPTYDLLGDERDSPRGRIYLIKEMLEQDSYPRSTITHLDRCLTCRSCETTCPSGVQYGKLLDIGRHLSDQASVRPVLPRLWRWTLRQILSSRKFFSLLLKLGQLYRPLLPAFLRHKVPVAKPCNSWPDARHERSMLVLQGCVQSSAAPETNAALAQLLDQLNISLIRAENEQCCGAMEYHLADQSAGLDRIRRQIDSWWPYVESGIEKIVITATGCGAMISDYGELLKHDPEYKSKAETIAQISEDVSLLLAAELSDWQAPLSNETVAWHSPCSLQHAQQINGVVEKLLTQSGMRLVEHDDAHLCCGSAGSYSILQPKISEQLLQRKLANLCADTPQQIVTANIGCQLHLQSGTEVPVKHWVEVIAEKYLASAKSA